MPEHVHLLLSEPERGNLAVVLQMLKQLVSQKLNEHITPPFWQPRYYDFNLCREQKLTEKLDYIHRNPVQRGLVTRPQDWTWSSAPQTARRREQPWRVSGGWPLRCQLKAPPSRKAREKGTLTPDGARGWNLNTINTFSGSNGSFPGHSCLAFFKDSNIFGTTDFGGKGYGVVYELQRKNNYKEVIIHNFTGQSDGADPDGQVRVENGHVFGTTQNGGDQSCSGGCGVVFEVTRTSDGWHESVLHSFDSSNGCFPSSGVILDTEGNAFGTTMDCNDNGTVFEISGLQ